MVCLTVVGDTSVNYRLLLELKSPRGVKQQVLILVTLMVKLLVVDAVLIRRRVLFVMGCPGGMVILAEALPRGAVQMLTLLLGEKVGVLLGLVATTAGLLRRGVIPVVPVNPVLNLLNDRNRVWL